MRPAFHRPFRRFCTAAAVLAAASLAGCGVLPRVAQQTAAAAIAPVAGSARVVSANLRAASQNLAASSAQTAATARRISRETAQARAAADAAHARSREAARAARQAAARNEAFNDALKARTEAGDAMEPPPFDILPVAVLAQLTEDQAGLQRAAQQEAFAAPVGETIYWEDGGRTGTAMARDETPMGGFLCRTFVQTVVIDAVERRGDALACRSPDGIWDTAHAQRQEAP